MPTPWEASTLRRPATVALQLLGDFGITVDGRPLEVSGSSRRLLALLALSEQSVNRGVAAATLWPESDDERAHANLRASLWRLPAPGGHKLVESVGQSLQLSNLVASDVRQAEALGWALVNDPAAVQPVEVPPKLFFDELLPGWYDDWLIFERERLAQLQRRFLEALVYRLIDDARLTSALDIALRLVHLDPLREASQRALISVYRAEGSYEDVSRQLAWYRRLVAETFDCEPSPELVAFSVAGRSDTPGQLRTLAG